MPNHAAIIEKATTVLLDVMQFRRMSDTGATCAATSCIACMEPHLRKVMHAIADDKPVTFVLPAFPGKSPSLAKVFGPLPDMAERCSLAFLGQLCERIGAHYAPGARIILCSDGRVFSDAVGMRDEDVTAYQQVLGEMIDDLGHGAITTFDLDEVYRDLDYHAMRDRLLAEHGAPIAALKDKVRRGAALGADRDSEDTHRLYCGITRFLLEDAMHPGVTSSRTALQKECRSRAYAVIQRSNAWSNLVASRFPDAVRLSIHPQACGSSKLGIRLLEAQSWMTPWHGVAVENDGHFSLLKRSEAEALGAHVVHANGRPSHFKISALNHGAAQS